MSVHEEFEIGYSGIALAESIDFHSFEFS